MDKEKKRMPKWLKATLITLGSVVGLAVVAVVVALWLVFTPSQLTKIANNLAAKYVQCETRLGRVKLTLFKTFPDAGLTIDNVYIVNPVEGAPSDTLASIGNLTIGVDLKKYLKEKEVVVHQVLLDDVVASIYIDPSGKGNYDIFPHSDDEDTVKNPFSLDSLPDMDLRKIEISDLDARLFNEKGRMDAIVENLDLGITGTLRNGMVDADLRLKIENGDLTIADSTGNPKTDAMLDGLSLDLDLEGNLDKVAGDLKLNLVDGRFNDFVNETLQASKRDLLTVKAPFAGDLKNGKWSVESGKLKIDDYAFGLSGDMQLKNDSLPMFMDLAVTSDGEWQVAPLLDIVPERFVKFRKNMDLDAKVRLEATAKGALADGKVPIIDASLQISDGLFRLHKSLPYRFSRINGDVATRLDLGKGGKSSVVVNRLKARTLGTDLNLKGLVDDLTGDIRIDAAVKGLMPLEDLQPMLHGSKPIAMQGKADLDIKADFRMSQLKAKAYEKMKLAGTVKVDKPDVLYDSIHVIAPKLDIAVQLPAKQFSGKMADVALKVPDGDLTLEKGTLKVGIDKPDIHAGLNNITKEQLAAAFNVSLGEGEAAIDSVSVAFGSLALNGSVRFDSTQQNVLRKYNPVADIALYNASVYGPQLPDALRLSQLVLDYKPELCDIKAAEVKVGHSDLQLYGKVEDLEGWLSHEKMLRGDLNLVSSYADVDELLGMISGMGSDKDTIEKMREEDKVPKDANPFLVPKDVDVTLHTHIKRSVALGNDLSDVAGGITVNNGVAVLDQIGFVCKAATMQLTAIYKSPRPNNLFASLDFHLLDIQIEELIDMIPVVDTLVPMLSSFEGNANFHLAAETFLNARYKPKLSTLIGSAAITGENLAVLDNTTIAQIAKLMKFKEWKDKDNKIRIDSLSVEMTCLRKEIEVFPFLLNIGKYQLCASGKHTLDNNCGYHVELLKNPLMAKVGVDITGTLKNPKISLGEVRYADLYKPEKQGVVEQQTLKLKKMVREALEANVR